MPDDYGKPNAGDPQGPFLFVPHGNPPPLDWMARHPGWVKFPATMVPQRSPTQAEPRPQARARTTTPLATPIMEAHHLVTIAAARANKEIFEAAVRGGWRMDDVPNTAALPGSRAAQQKLGNAGINRPIHDNRHHNWNEEVDDRMKNIPGELREAGLIEKSPEYDRAVARAMEAIQDDLRRQMLGLKRVTQNEEGNFPPEA